MLPSWVKGRDGQLIAFEADAIGASLFDAAQTLGAADAFLIRELSDGVLHFLTQEDFGETAPAAAIDDIVEKVVRELGQPTLARAFARRAEAPLQPPSSPPLNVPYSPGDPPDAVVERCLHAYSLRSIFSADIAAAHQQGLIQIDGLDTPRQLEAATLEAKPIAGDPFSAAWDLVEDGARRARRLVLDGPEWMPDRAAAIAPFLAGLERAAAAHRCSVDLHLNAASPTRTEPVGAGPLFAPETRIAATAASEWLAVSNGSVRIAWHWRDDAPANAAFLEWLTTTDPAAWSVIFDRPGDAVSLGCGLSRRRPGVLLAVALDLPRLLHRPEVGCQSDTFLEKLPSLSRLALTAGVQMRNSLRRTSGHLGREFLLDRAAMRIVPLGFATVLQQLMGVRWPATKPARALATALLRALRAPFDDTRRRTGLESLLDAPDDNVDDLDSARALVDAARGLIDDDCIRVTFAGRPFAEYGELIDQTWRTTTIRQIAHNDHRRAEPRQRG